MRMAPDAATNLERAVAIDVSAGEAYEHLAVFAAVALLSFGLCTLVVGRRDA